MQTPITLDGYTKTIQENVDAFKTSFPMTFQASETLTDIFWKLYQHHLDDRTGILWQMVVRDMVFGCFSSWSHAFTMSAAGLDEHGLTSMRRAIEFACYIAKVNGSDDRAQMWIDQRDSVETRRSFSLVFSIPRAYPADRYPELKDLLVFHEEGSDFGVHGNLTMLGPKSRESEGMHTMFVFDEPSVVPLMAFQQFGVGAHILGAVVQSLRGTILNPSAFVDEFPAFHDQRKAALVEIEKYEESLGFGKEMHDLRQQARVLLDDKFEQLLNQQRERDAKKGFNK